MHPNRRLIVKHKHADRVKFTTSLLSYLRFHAMIYASPKIPILIFCIIFLGRDHQEPVVSGLVPRVIYESNRILAIDKPPGISHHNDDETGELGIVSQLRAYYETLGSNSEGQPPFRLYGVHRLDRVTSGILLFAKDGEMAAMLSKAFRDKAAVKYYIGISNRKPKKKKQGWVKGTMVRGRRKSWYLTNSKDPDEAKGSAENGQSSESNHAITRFFTAGLGELGRDDTAARTCILFRPHTGKTHQLRVAAKSVGLPLLGDPIYGADVASDGNCSRAFLHAAAIHISMDGSENGRSDEEGGHESVTIWCPPPFAPLLWKDDAQEAFDQITTTLLEKHCESPEVLSLLR